MKVLNYRILIHSFLFLSLLFSFSSYAEMRRGFILSDFGIGEDASVTTAIAFDSQQRIILLREHFLVTESADLISDIMLTCIASDGEICDGFGSSGTVSFDSGLSGYDIPIALAIDTNDRILFGGFNTASVFAIDSLDNLNFFINRYSSDGVLDLVFGTDGILNGDLTTFEDSFTSLRSFDMESYWTLIPTLLYLFNGEALEVDLKIYAPDGTPHVISAGTMISLPNGFIPHETKLDSQNRMVIAGYYNGIFAAARMFLTGEMDSSFGTDGFFTTDLSCLSESANLAAVAEDDSIYLVGTCYQTQSYYLDFAIAKLDANGNLDPAYGTNGITITDIGEELDTTSHEEADAIALDNNGNLIIAGTSYSRDYEFGEEAIILRYTPAGTLDSSFGDLVTESEETDASSSGLDSADTNSFDTDTASASSCQLQPKATHFGSLQNLLCFILFFLIGGRRYLLAQSKQTNLRTKP